MSELELESARLEAVADLVPVGRPMADIGTDHAYLPCALVRSGRVPRAIASDLRAGPLQAAARSVEAVGVGVELRQGDGLSVLRPGEVHTVVLAGMGGERMTRLVDAAPRVVDVLGCLVLQPNTGWVAVRRWIARAGWALSDETLVADGGKFYLTLALDPRRSAQHSWSADDLDLGPILRHRRGSTFEAWCRTRLRERERALQRARAGARSDDPRVQALERGIERLRSALVGVLE